MTPHLHHSSYSLSRLSRRELLLAGGLALAGWGFSHRILAAEPNAGKGIAEIRLQSDTLGTVVGFDPIGIYVQPGTIVRWVLEANVHTVTAYHPRNANHSLRIPKEAQPFDSGFLVNPGATFEQRLTVEGVYDYFCLPHEIAGMVGRIVVGKATGPGALPFDYFKGLPEAKGWLEVPEAAQAAFPSIERILREKIVRGPLAGPMQHHEH
jgi:plastocyanin